MSGVLLHCVCVCAQSSCRSLSGGTPVGGGRGVSSPRRSSAGLKTAPPASGRGGEWETGGGGEGVRMGEGRMAEQQAMASIGEAVTRLSLFKIVFCACFVVQLDSL